MIKTTFYLHSRKSNHVRPIAARFRHRGKVKDFGLGLSIHEELWQNNRTGPASHGTVYKRIADQYPEMVNVTKNVSRRIIDIRDHVEQYERDMHRQGALVSLDGLIEYLTQEYAPLDKQVQSMYLEDYLKQWIADAKKGRRTHGKEGRLFKEPTIKIFRTLLSDISRMSPKKTLFEDLGPSYMQRFDKYCNDQDYRSTTKAKKFSKLIAICNAAQQEGLHSFNANAYRKDEGKTHKIALSEQELKAIERLDLSDSSEGKRIARDRFVIGCYTGLRISDLLRLNEQDHIIKDDQERAYLSITTIKGNAPIYFRCPDKVLQVLEHYRNKSFDISEPMLNRYIKVIAKKAGIDGTEIYQVSQGGQQVKLSTPRYELITSHTARRTAVTTLRRLGWSYEQIMIVTGHKTLEVIKRYDRTTKEDKAASIENLPFIGDNHLSVVS